MDTFSITISLSMSSIIFFCWFIHIKLLDVFCFITALYLDGLFNFSKLFLIFFLKYVGSFGVTPEVIYSTTSFITKETILFFFFFFKFSSFFSCFLVICLSLRVAHLDVVAIDLVDHPKCDMWNTRGLFKTPPLWRLYNFLCQVCCSKICRTLSCPSALVV